MHLIVPACRTIVIVLELKLVSEILRNGQERLLCCPLPRTVSANCFSLKLYQLILKMEGQIQPAGLPPSGQWSNFIDPINFAPNLVTCNIILLVFVDGLDARLG